MQDFMRMYSSLVERCFNACCNDFTSKALSGKEASDTKCPVAPERPMHCLRMLISV